MKTKTTIRIEKELLTKAEQYGLNLSRTVENLLHFYLEGIEQIQTKIQNQNSSKIGFSLSEGSLLPKEKVLWWGSWDLNPGPPAPQAGILDQARRLPHFRGRVPCYLCFLKSLMLFISVTYSKRLLQVLLLLCFSLLVQNSLFVPLGKCYCNEFCSQQRLSVSENFGFR